MPNLSIKDVPEQWAHALRRRAAQHHRSLQGELMAMIEKAVAEAPADSNVPAGGFADAPTPRRGDSRVVGHDRFGYPIIRQGWKTVEQVAAELRAKYPEPISSDPSSVNIIRHDRDSR